MKHLTVKIDGETLAKIDRGARRKARIVNGQNDGRFITKVVASKKKYSRKQKHKNLEY